jgi:3-oxoadipate enol-lactonase
MHEIQRIDLGHITLNVSERGTRDTPCLVFAHPLGTNLHLWDAVLSALPSSLWTISYDTRGHGASDTPDAPYSMGQLITDAERLLDHLKVRDCLFIGAGLGGLVAQGLAVKRLDQVRALILANTAAKIGYKPHWLQRIAQVQEHGMSAALPHFVERYMGLHLRHNAQALEAVQLWHDILSEMNPQGYIGSCAAISGTDFYTPTASLRLPCLGISGLNDQITPPDLVRETIDLIPGAQFKILRRSGHLPAAENPEGLAQLITEFCREIGHL